MKKFTQTILTLLLLVSSFTALSQKGIWINEYSLNKEVNKKSDRFSNRLMLKINNDSIFFFDPGKEEWKGYFQNGFSYIKNKETISIEKNDTDIQLINKNQIILKNGNQFLYFKKIKPSKRILKFKKLISNNIFISNLGHSFKKDTISFQLNRKSPQYNFKNIGTNLIALNKDKFFLFMDFEGEKIYEINHFNKNGFSFTKNSKKGNKIINFETISIKNLNKHKLKKVKLMLE